MLLSQITLASKQKQKDAPPLQALKCLIINYSEPYMKWIKSVLLDSQLISQVYSIMIGHPT